MAAATMNLARIAATAVAIALTACATTESRPPDVELPAPTTTHIAGIERWWTQFNDPQVTALIEEAIVANLDLRVAVARIDEARANLQAARSFLYPRIEGYAGFSRSRASRATDFIFVGPTISNAHSAGIQASYELDLWGRVRSGSSAADAQLLATRYNAETVRTVLAAQVATTYFSLRAFDAELKITRDTLGTRAENVKLQKQRFDAGLVGEYGLRCPRPNAQRWPHRYRCLSGRSHRPRLLWPSWRAKARARYIRQRLRAEPISKRCTSGLRCQLACRADLLARRPDIRQAEASLVAADFRISEARAQYYPSLMLTGSFGSESSDLSDLFTSPARISSIGLNLLQPILTRGASARRSMQRLHAGNRLRSAMCNRCNQLFETLMTHWSPIALRAKLSSLRTSVARSCGSRASVGSALQRRLFEFHRRARQSAQFARRRACARECVAGAPDRARRFVQGARRRLVTRRVRGELGVARALTITRSCRPAIFDGSGAELPRSAHDIEQRSDRKFARGPAAQTNQSAVSIAARVQITMSPVRSRRRARSSRINAMPSPETTRLVSTLSSSASTDACGGDNDRCAKQITD